MVVVSIYGVYTFLGIINEEIKGGWMSVLQDHGCDIVVSKDQLVNFFTDGCRSYSDTKVGLESERFCYKIENNKPLEYSGSRSIHGILEYLSCNCEYSPVYENDSIVGLTTEIGGSVSLEPGCQVEFASAPVRTLRELQSQIDKFSYDMKRVADYFNIGYLFIGSTPDWGLKDIPHVPKDRYKIMRGYMPLVGDSGLDMMFRTCSTHISLDFTSESNMVDKFRLASRLHFVVAAILASSPFLNGVDQNTLSVRGRIWDNVDKHRSGIPRCIFEKGFGFERWVDFVMDVPMYFVYRNGQYIPTEGHSFRDFLSGSNSCVSGYPTFTDWANHVTTVFTDVRIKKYLEIRSADSIPENLQVALVALWLGIMDDHDILGEVTEMVSDWTYEYCMQLQRHSFDRGIHTEIAKHGSIKALLNTLLEFASNGLEKRRHALGLEYDEVEYLDSLRRILVDGKSYSEVMHELYHGVWRKDVSKLYAVYGSGSLHDSIYMGA